MRKLFKLRIVEEKDAQKIVSQFSKELKAQREFMYRELAERDKRIEFLEDTLKKQHEAYTKYIDEVRSVFQHIMLYLPVKQNRTYRDYHDKKLAKHQQQEG